MGYIEAISINISPNILCLNASQAKGFTPENKSQVLHVHVPLNVPNPLSYFAVVAQFGSRIE